MAACTVLTTGLALLTSLSLPGKNKDGVYNGAVHLMQRWSVSGGITFTCHATFGTGATGWNRHLLPCIVPQYANVSPWSEQMVRSAAQRSPKLFSRLLGKREHLSYQNVVKPLLGPAFWLASISKSKIWSFLYYLNSSTTVLPANYRERPGGEI